MESSTFHSSYSTTTKVLFVDIKDQYDYDEDLVCRYDLDGHVAVEGDRIAIYKSGWLFVKDYFLFEWVPIISETRNNNVVKFNKICLPRDESEFYQFCYISAENEVLGASKTFQFSNVNKNFGVLSLDSSEKSINMGVDSICTSKELRKLREENEILKESLKLFMAQKKPRDYDRDITELKTMIYSLKDVASRNRNEIDFLKRQMQVCLAANEKLSEEKTEVERKCRKLLMATGNGFNDIRFSNLELESIPPIPDLSIQINKFHLKE